MPSEFSMGSLELDALLEELRPYVAQLTRESDWQVSLEVDADWTELSPALEAALSRAIRVTVEGRDIIAPSMIPRFLRRVGQMMNPLPAAPACVPVENLSKRELQVLGLVA